MNSHIGIDRAATVQRADVFAQKKPRTPQKRQYAQYTLENSHTHVASDMALAPFVSLRGGTPTTTACEIWLCEYGGRSRSGGVMPRGSLSNGVGRWAPSKPSRPGATRKGADGARRALPDAPHGTRHAATDHATRRPCCGGATGGGAS